MKNKTSVFLNIILCLSVCFFAACNKESGPTTVNGTVRDVTTNVGISNAEVGLFETDGESAFGLGGVLMEEKYSDASGEFIFSFDAREGYQYYVQAIKEQYFNDQSNNVTFINVNGNLANIAVYLQPEAHLIVHLKNINVYDPWDYIIFSNAYVSFYGSEVDTSILLLVNGSVYNHLVWFVYNDGENNGSESADVFCQAFDTTYYEILY